MRTGNKYLKAWTLIQEVLNLRKTGNQSKIYELIKKTLGIQLLNVKVGLNHYEDLLVENRPQFLNDEHATNIDISMEFFY